MEYYDKYLKYKLKYTQLQAIYKKMAQMKVGGGKFYWVGKFQQEVEDIYNTITGNNSNSPVIITGTGALILLLILTNKLEENKNNLEKITKLKIEQLESIDTEDLEEETIIKINDKISKYQNILENEGFLPGDLDLLYYSVDKSDVTYINKVPSYGEFNKTEKNHNSLDATDERVFHYESTNRDLLINEFDFLFHHIPNRRKSKIEIEYVKLGNVKILTPKKLLQHYQHEFDSGDIINIKRDILNSIIPSNLEEFSLVLFEPEPVYDPQENHLNFGFPPQSPVGSDLFGNFPEESYNSPKKGRNDSDFHPDSSESKRMRSILFDSPERSNEGRISRGLSSPIPPGNYEEEQEDW